MSDDTYGLACGGYTYTLEYDSTGDLWDSSTNTGPDISSFTLTEYTGSNLELSATVTDFAWDGDHYFKIKC